MIDWIYQIFRAVFPAKLPAKLSFRRILDNNAGPWKVSAMVKAKCGLLVCTYHNTSRNDACVNLVNPNDGTERTLIRTNAETYGRPVKYGGKWYFTQEDRGQIVIVDDATGKVSRGRTQPTDYSTCGLGKWFAVVARAGAGYPWLWDFRDGGKGHQYKRAKGIPSAIAKDGGYVIAVQDGAPAGIEWEDGKYLPDGAAGLERIGNRLLAFTKSGDIRVVTGGRYGPVIARYGRKYVRASQSGGIVYALTSNPDSLIVCNGDDAKLVFDFPGPDLSDGTRSGSLFDGDVVAEGKTVWVARSLHNGGYEVWKGTR